MVKGRFLVLGATSASWLGKIPPGERSFVVSERMKQMPREGKKRGPKLAAALFLLFIMSLGWNNSGRAQVVPSETESLIVLPTAVPKITGSTVSVVISLANDRYIAGISGRLVYDTNLVAPLVSESTLVGGVYQYKFSIDKLDRKSVV